MSVPLLDLKAQYATIRDEVNEAVLEVLESQYFVLGPKVAELEAAVAAYCGVKHAIGVSSGTDALLLSLMAADIGPGDEVITTPYSFFATAGSIARVGARPVFVDIDPVSFNIDPAHIEDAVSARTRAIIPVHLYGQVCAMDAIVEVAERHNLLIIEDAAQAIGAMHGTRKAGQFGGIGCFSFFPSKNLGGAGDGGMVVTDDDLLANALRIKRVHGGHTKYEHEVIGGNFRLDAIQAAVLLVKLKQLDAWTDGRRRNADRYRHLFREAGVVLDPQACHQDGCRSYPDCALHGTNKLILPHEPENVRHIYNQFVIRIDRRDEARAFLQEREVGHEVYYPIPFHLQACFADLGYKQGDFPASECAADQSLALPIYPELSDDQLREVVGAVVDFLHR